jgi:hypothetical protein
VVASTVFGLDRAAMKSTVGIKQLKTQPHHRLTRGPDRKDQARIESGIAGCHRPGRPTPQG